MAYDILNNYIKNPSPSTPIEIICDHGDPITYNNKYVGCKTLIMEFNFMWLYSSFGKRSSAAVDDHREQITEASRLL